MDIINIDCKVVLRTCPCLVYIRKRLLPAISSGRQTVAARKMAAFLAVVLLGLVSQTQSLTHQQMNSQIHTLKSTVETLAKQLMIQQQFVEERIRSDGDSGIKQIRHTHKGTRSYYGDTFSRGSVLSIHDHSNYDRTIGMGEFIGVLNGVEFRTRHNDYKLRSASHTKKDYHAMDDVPFPPIPHSVTSKPTVAAQIDEMREYFRAFKEQSTHIRSDYKKYFKPVLCYLEGAWTTDTKSLNEPFHSDRHFIDASSWFDLQEKVRYTSYTGGKSNFENYSFLPTSIIDVRNGTPEFAQWNYRILCHPIQTDLGLTDFSLIDDIATRLANVRNMDDYSKTRNARFGIAANRGFGYNSTLGYGKEIPKEYTFGLLDKIMQEIPGKDNYGAHLQDPAFGMHQYDMANPNGLTPLNTAHYHRIYKGTQDGHKGSRIVHRGYADQNLWVAQTTQPRIAPVNVTSCHNDANHQRVCTEYSSKYSYAVPLEIIWLTPLYTWNPYDLAFHLGNINKPPANAVTAGGRNGETTPSKAYNGTNLNTYYFTPVDFFLGSEVGRDPADTARDSVGVLDKHGHMQLVKASGTRIFLPEIKGVGKLRMRYPIMPSHHEGNAVWKEIDALKDMVMQMQKYAKYFETPPVVVQKTNASNILLQKDAHFQTSETHGTAEPGPHKHDVYVPQATFSKQVSHGHTVTVTTEIGNGHSHTLQFHYDGHSHKYVITKCDDTAHCWDGHNQYLNLLHD